MIRQGLCVVLALLVAAGPSICRACCSVTQLAAAACMTTSEPPSCSCCRERSPGNPPGECPCRKNAEPCGRFVATPPKADVFDARLSVPVVAFDLAPVFRPVPSPYRSPAGELPFLSVEDLLDVQHRLRC